MLSLSSTKPSWAAVILFLSALLSSAFAYRPLQFCKHRGENGKAEVCFSITSFFNTTTSQTDLYIRLQTYRYKSSKKGWAALGLGERMTGSLMFIVYGDPEAANGEMTTSVRTANGHHPPQLITDQNFYAGDYPEIMVTRSEFVAYEGEYVNPQLSLKPTHVGISDIICYSCRDWQGFLINNASTRQPMIWSTNFKQDFLGDFATDIHIDMHQFGLGFGFAWADLVHTRLPDGRKGFKEIKETGGHTGISEIGDPAPPSEEELTNGKFEKEFLPASLATPESSHEEPAPAPKPTSKPAPAPAPSTQAPDDHEDEDDDHDHDHSDDHDGLLEPTTTILGKTLRDWMWHMHGFLMALAFLVLYPLGSTFIRTTHPKAFNYHWTTQALASMLVIIGAVIGYWNSHSISVMHQYLGIGIVLLIGGQVFLGWRHHMAYLVIKRKTWMSRVHVWLGRLVLGAGFVNLVLGVILRSYIRLVVFLLCVAIVGEVVGLVYMLGRGRIRQLAMPVQDRGNVEMAGQEAEEYFQLVGDDDEGDIDDSDEEAGGAKKDNSKADAKTEQARRLAKLDKV